jgi:hypothetical protein
MCLTLLVLGLINKFYLVAFRDRRDWLTFNEGYFTTFPLATTRSNYLVLATCIHKLPWT